MHPLEKKLINWGLPRDKYKYAKQAWDSYASTVEQADDDTYVKKDRAIATGIICAYVMLYKPNEFVDIVPEYEFEKALNGFLFCGRVDALIKPIQWIMENKTWSMGRYYHSWQHYIDSMHMSDQPTGYIWATDTLGMYLNLLRKSGFRQSSWESTDKYCDRILKDYITRPTEYIRREQVYRSKREIDTWVEETKQAIHDMEDCEHFYKSTEHCGNFGGCDYNILCKTGEDEQIKQELFRVWQEKAIDREV